jgi:hypothetical protein
VQVGKLALQFDQRVAGAGNIAGAAGARAHAGRGLNHGADHLRMLTHAEVVVRAPDHSGARAVGGMPDRVGKTPGDAFEVGEDAVAAFLVQAGKRPGKEMIIGHRAKSASGLAV